MALKAFPPVNAVGTVTTCTDRTLREPRKKLTAGDTAGTLSTASSLAFSGSKEEKNGKA